jgi:uncharacterized protein (TIGR00255 family)
MRSMTGYGQASWEGRGRRLAVEVRSVNHRFLDVKLSLPRDAQAWEPELRQMITGRAERGKIDVSVNRGGTPAGELAVEVNEPLARALLAAWRRLQRRLGLPGEIDLSLLLQHGELVRVVERRPEPGDDLPRVRRLLTAALRAWNRAREREGRVLAADMRARLRALRRIRSALDQRTRALVPELARRVRERVAELLENEPPNSERLLQEAAFLAERADVTEELVRLASHLDRLGEIITAAGPAGKQLDFLLQEIHREINTIASKSADLEVTRLTLEARGEVEKLREQVQNVE